MRVNRHYWQKPASLNDSRPCTARSGPNGIGLQVAGYQFCVFREYAGQTGLARYGFMPPGLHMCKRKGASITVRYAARVSASLRCARGSLRCCDRPWIRTASLPDLKIARPRATVAPQVAQYLRTRTLGKGCQCLAAARQEQETDACRRSVTHFTFRLEPYFRNNEREHVGHCSRMIEYERCAHRRGIYDPARETPRPVDFDNGSQ